MKNDSVPLRTPRATVVLVVVAIALMAILIFSVGSSAFAASNVLGAGSGRAQIVAEHHKPGHDNGGGNGPFSNGENEEGGREKEENGNHGKGNGGNDSEKRGSMLQPVPSSLDNFELSVEGIALTKRDGRDGPFADAKVDLHATILREEGNHLRFQATGTVDVDGDGEYDIVDAQGIVIFFKTLRGEAVTGLVHIVGKHAVDEHGNDLGKFRLRALVIDSAKDDTWRVIVFPAGRLGGHIMLVNMGGTITGIDGSQQQQPPPTHGSPAPLHHFDVSAIPSSVTAGSGISVTVTARMANGTLLKSYDDKAKITDATGTVTPIITPRFQEGVFKGTLNITKTSNLDKVKFTDVDTGKTGESNSFSVVAGSLSNVELSPSDVNLSPSGKAQFTAKGTDRFGNELGGLSFAWSLSSQDYGSISTAGSRANFTAGSSISSTVKLNLTASTGGSGGKSDRSVITITPKLQVLDHFVIGNISSPQTAGSPFQVTIRAVNSTGASITGYSGPMHLTDSTGTLDMTINSGFVNGLWTGNANITEANSKVRISASDVASPSKKGTSNEFAVTAGALHHFDIDAIANQTAGVQFNVAVRAEDAYGNLKPDYAGNVTLGTNDGASPIGNLTLFNPGSHNFTAGDGGRFTFTATMYNARDDVTVTAAGSGKSGTSNEFDVRSTTSAVAKVSVSPTSATVNPGGKVTFGAQAFDAYGNSITNGGAGAEAAVDFQWSLDLDSLGDIDGDGASAVFTASSSISTSVTGTVVAKLGAATGSASITVEA
ncbi:MAG TPA: hypothetical protein VJP79_03710 [Nitrososphaera sp.]|nr:hypothetical protein [Nitrososphaera sp.]